MPSTRRSEAWRDCSCADERQRPEIVAVADQHVEGIELDFFIVLARVQADEVGSAVDAEQHSFTVNHKGALAVSQRGLDNEGKAVAPVVPIAGEQPNALAFTLNDQSIAVVLDFVKPFRPVRNLVPRVGMQGSNADVRMRDK